MTRAQLRRSRELAAPSEGAAGHRSEGEGGSRGSRDGVEGGEPNEGANANEEDAGAGADENRSWWTKVGLPVLLKNPWVYPS